MPLRFLFGLCLCGILAGAQCSFFRAPANPDLLVGVWNCPASHIFTRDGRYAMSHPARQGPGPQLMEGAWELQDRQLFFFVGGVRIQAEIQRLDLQELSYRMIVRNRWKEVRCSRSDLDPEDFRERFEAVHSL